jgi:heme A synthase
MANRYSCTYLFLQILSGTLNTLFDIPAMVNVIHIAASAAIVGIQLWLIRNRE